MPNDVSARKMPLAHRAAFAFSHRGFRPAHRVWSLAWRTTPENDGWFTLPDGRPHFLTSRDWMSRTTYEGTFDRAVLAAIPRLVRPGDAFIDVGANIGITAAAAASTLGSDGLIVALEPSPRCTTTLRELSTLIPTEIRIIPAAAGPEFGSAMLHGSTNQNHSGLGSLRPGVVSIDGLPVDVIPVDSVLSQLGARDLGLFKVDVEGFESEVLAGAQVLLRERRARHLLLEISPQWGDVSWVKHVWQQLGPSYRGYSLQEAGQFRHRVLPAPITVEGALQRKDQWNLLLSRSSAGY